MRTSEALRSFFILSVLLITISASVAAGDWPMFLHDSQHTGTSGISPGSHMELAWSFDTQGSVTSSPAVGDGVVFFTSEQYVYARSTDNGDEVWTINIGENTASSPIIVNGVVYLGAGSFLFALNGENGEQLWKYPTGGNVASTPAVFDGVVYFGSWDGSVYALDAQTGDKLWSNETGDVVRSSPAIINETLFIGSKDKKVYALDVDTGHKKWEYETGESGWGVISSPAVTNDLVYVGAYDQSVYALDTDTGEQRWSFPTGGFVKSSPAAVNGTVYIGSHDGYVYALDADTGEEEWTFGTGKLITSSPILADGLVYIGSQNGIFYCLKASDGQELWRFNAGEYSDISSSAAIAEGMVFVGSENGYLYAFRKNQTVTPTPTPVPSPTPTPPPPPPADQEIVTVTVLRGHNDGLTDVYADDKYLFTASSDTTVRVWSRSDLSHVTTLEHSGASVQCIHSDADYIYTGLSNGKGVQVWSGADFSKVTVLEHPCISNQGGGETCYPVTAVYTFGDHIYTTSNDKLHVWYKANFSSARTLEYNDPLTDVFVDSDYVYVVSGDKKVHIEKRTDYTHVTNLEGHSNYVYGVYADPNYIYTASNDKTVRVWSRSDFSSMKVLEGHTDRVTSVFADTFYVYSTSFDGSVRIWSRSELSPVKALEGHAGSVIGKPKFHSVFADADYVIIASDDKTASVWKWQDAGASTTQPPPPTPTMKDWLMQGHDPSHSGNAGDEVVPPLELLWEYETGDLVRTSPAVSDGVVYIGSRDNYLYALDGSTSELKWKYKTGDRVESSPAVVNGIVYVGSLDHYLYALDATTGEELWKYETGGQLFSSPTVSDGVVYIGSHDLHFYALDALTGELKWKMKRSGATGSTPAVSEEIVFWGDSTSDQGILTLDTSTGDVIWGFTTGSGVSSTPAVWGNVVYAGTNTRLLAIDVNTGWRRWQYEGGVGGAFYSPAISDGVVYVGSQDNNVYAFDSADGDVRWKTGTGMVQDSPAVSGGIIYVGSQDQHLYALNKTTGESIWQYSIGSHSRGGPAVSGGIVYIGGGNSLFAFSVEGAGTPSPSSTSTPTPVPSSTASPSPTSVPTYQPTPTPTPTSTPRPPSDVPHSEPTPTSAPSANVTATPTPTPSPTSNATPSNQPPPTVAPPVNATARPSTDATPVPSTLPIPTSTPTPTIKRKKAIGAVCFSNDECAANNCQNMRCCANGKTCCGFDRHCGLNDTCNRALAHCVLKPPPPPREVITQNLTALTRDVKDLAGRKDEVERALERVLDRDEIEQRLRQLDTLVEELETLSGELNTTADDVALRRKEAAEKALRRIKDVIVTNITQQRTFKEVEVEMDEEFIDSVIDKLPRLTSGVVLQDKDEATRLAMNITQKKKAEVVEAEYASGKKGKKTLVTQSIVNKGQEPIKGAVVVVEIPKSVAISALLLRYKCERSSGRPCPKPQILRDDPIVAWDLSVLEAGETVIMTYTTDGETLPDETGAVVVTTGLDLASYRTVEDTRESLTTEVIEQNLTSLSAEILSIEDSEVREKIENLTEATQDSLAEADLITAYAAVAQIRQEIESVKAAVVTPEPTSALTPEPLPSATPTPPETTPAVETEEPLSLRRTPLETFVDSWEILVGLCGALSIIGYYLHILKRKTLGEEKVKVKRGVTREGHIIKIGVKVVNDSTFPLVDVSVQLDVPKAFRIEGGSKFIDLGILKQGEFQSAIFKLVPTRCVSGNITGTVTYHDVKNNRKVLEIQDVTVGSVCPFLEKVPVTYEAFDEKVKPLPSHSKRMTYSLEPGDIYQKLQGKCSSMHVVHEGYSDDGTKYIGLYSARGAYSKNFIGMRLGLDMSSNELVVQVYGEQEEMVTGLLSEIVELLET